MVHELRSLPVERLKLLVFDLDGTLIDSAQDLCNSVNATLIHFGREPLEDATIAAMIGDGVLMLVRRAFARASGPAADEDLLGKAHAWFLEYYREHKLDFTYAYEGVLEALAALRALRDQPCCTGMAMAVLTNKPVRPAREICAALGLAPYFLNIYGGNSFTTKKPDPLGVQTILQETGVPADEALMIGDSSIDVLTGRNAGLWTCGVTYGFSPHSLDEVPPDVLIENPHELGDLLR